MQTLDTQNFGKLTFVRTWIGAANTHIGLLAKGGYCHLGGPPIKSLAEIKDAMTPGKALDAAIHWWNHKDEIRETDAKIKSIMINSTTGDYQFDDGSPIKDVADLISSLPSGPALNAAIAWFAGKEKDKIDAEKKEVDIIEDRSRQESAKVGQKRCQAINADGVTQCKRFAIAGSDYCALPLHQKLAKEKIAPVPEPDYEPAAMETA